MFVSHHSIILPVFDLHSISYDLRRCDSKALIDLPSHRNVDTHSVVGNDVSPLVDPSHFPSTRVIGYYDDIHTAALGLLPSECSCLILLTISPQKRGESIAEQAGFEADYPLLIVPLASTIGTMKKTTPRNSSFRLSRIAESISACGAASGLLNSAYSFAGKRSSLANAGVCCKCMSEQATKR